MAGGRNKHGGGGGQPPFKKRKRSKAFWQQRETLDTKSRMPQANSESSSESDAGSVDENEVPESQYQSLLTAFSNGRQGETKIVDDEDKSSEEEVEEEESEKSESESDSSESGASEKDTNEKSNDKSDNEKKSKDLAKSDESVKSDNESGTESEEEIDKEEEATRVGTPDDPFVARMSAKISDSVKSGVDERKYLTTGGLNWKHLGKLSLQQLQTQSQLKNTGSQQQGGQKKSLLTLDSDDEEESSDGTSALTQAQLSLMAKDLAPDWDSALVKQQLVRNALKSSTPDGAKSSLTGLESELLSVMQSYKDLNFNERSQANGEEVRFSYSLHTLDHVLKARTKVLANNERLAKLKTTKERLRVEARDQGLCRPRVLIVVPFKESARRVVSIMKDLLFGGSSEAAETGGNKKASNKGVGNLKKFEEEFGGLGPPPVSGTGVKPDDHYQTFAGNTDDAFRIGLTVSKKQLKLYTEFYSSDVIIASPLGLRMVIGSEGEDEKKDFDFLASIEVLVLDQVDVFAMQNWEHVTTVLSHVNTQPLRPHGVDFSRVRMWALDKLSKYYRQTLVFSGVTGSPEVNSIFTKHCFNFCGRVRQVNPVVNGSICQVVNTSVPVVFRKFAATSVTSSPNDRFDFFVKKVMPEYVSDLRYRTLIFVPSYFDFVRVRNWFDKESFMDFAEICEYTKYSKMASARDKFFHGEHHFLLYTERAHFYKRFAIKGVRHLVFYQPPHYPRFFSEICNLMQAAYQNKKASGGSENMSCTVIYCKYDVARVNAIAGSDRAKTMLTSDKSVHMFDTGKT